MPTTGGIYALPTSSFYPAVADTDIDPDDSNSTLADVAQGLTDRLMADGSKQWSGNHDAGGHKLGSLAAATVNGDAVRYEQVFPSLFQPLDSTLTALAGLSTSASTYIRCTGTDAFTVDSYATVLSNIAAAPSARLLTAGTGLTGGGDLTADRTFAIAAASAANYWAATANKVLTADGVNATGALTALTDAATVAVDMSLGVNFSLTIGGNRTLGAPSNTQVGRSGCIYVTQDGTGSRTLAYNGVYKFAGGSAPVLSTAAGAIDRLTYFVRSASLIDIDISKARA